MKTQIRMTKTPASRHLKLLVGAAFILSASMLMSGCGFFKKHSVRTISATHWGTPQGSVSGMSSAPDSAPAPEPVSEEAAPKDAKNADAPEAAEAVAENPEALSGATASTANIGGAAQSPSADGDMTLYVAYTEAISASNLLNNTKQTVRVRSLLRICTLQEDNSLVCTENSELNAMLNPHLTQPK